MKKLVLLSRRSIIGRFYYEDLLDLFAGYFSIQSCSMEECSRGVRPQPDLSDADIVLTTSSEAYAYFMNRIGGGAKVVSLTYAISRANVEYLKSFPHSTRALLYFALPTMAYKLTFTLYELGVHNLRLTSHRPQDKPDGVRYDLAIVDDYSPAERPNADVIFNLGRRRISFMTLIQLATEGGVLDAALEKRLFAYSSDQASTTDIMQKIYEDFSYLSSQARILLEHIDSAIVILNSRHQVVSCNQAFLLLLGLPDDVVGRGIAQLPQMESLAPVLMGETRLLNRLIRCKSLNKNLVVIKENISKNRSSETCYLVMLKDMTEITRLETSLQRQLKHQGYVAKYTFDDIKCRSAVMLDCVDKARRIARIDKNTLILGESGTGKELLAQSIHAASARSGYPFVSINCAALPASLLESELFGYEEGSFTGAKKGGKAGLFELAHRGTVFLDEIGEMAPEVQAKLLRVVEEKEIMKLGGDRLTSVDVRVIAATHRDLKALVREGRFRLDLYYRLNTVIIQIPPLRRRREDIPYLVELFSVRAGSGPPSVSEEVTRLFGEYGWEGNVRELRNCVEYASSVSGGMIELRHLPDYMQQETAAPPGEPEAAAPALPFLERYNGEERAALLEMLRLARTGVHGRRKIHEALRKTAGQLSEYRTRQLLAQLREEGLLTFGRGRAGVRLTDRGADFLRRGIVSQ